MNGIPNGMFGDDFFFSPFISNAQRLPNGNTLITEGSDGRIFEVTAEHEIVWEYICPYKGTVGMPMNWVYRAYRVPYEWVPQAPHPEHVEISRSMFMNGVCPARLPSARRK